MTNRTVLMMNFTNKNIYFNDTPIGKIGIAEKDGLITNLFFASDSFNMTGFMIAQTEVLENAFVQLLEYLVGERREFNLKLAPEGTEFQNLVWSRLLSISFGGTKTYAELAAEIGNKNASRAVGGACNKNPIPVFIPCHRVVGSHGSLTGYRGGILLKEKLLMKEGAI